MPQLDQLAAVLDRRLEGRRLLTHPFYTRWSEGGVGVEELRGYAAQYRHFEAALPELLRRVAESATQPALRQQALRNLEDEAGGSPTHLELFDVFAGALDADVVPPSPAMSDLLRAYGDAVSSSAACGFAAVLAYEAQAAGVAASKAGGLRRHGILDGDALRFWDVHAELDADHAAWALDALSRSDESIERLDASVGAAADAWWIFLDEREALHTANGKPV